MSEPSSLAFPETRLASERLWVSSALSVLRAHLCAHQALDEGALAWYTAHALEAMGALNEALRTQEEPTGG
jgi:hypothetical protein